MTADEIVRQRQQDWTRLEALVVQGSGRRANLDPAQLLELSGLYRAACADAARVRAAGADDGTVAYLDTLLARAHNQLYQAPPTPRGAVRDFLAAAFPQAVRRNAAFFWWASAAFYGPFALGLACALALPGFAAGVMGQEMLENFRRMYEDMPEAGRSAGEGSLGVSFYIQHNTSIGFRVFANGVFFGLGSAAMLVYQGLVIGTTFGFLVGDEKARQILTFTCGHSAWELTAIVLAGAAGLRMGWALVATEGRTRLGSLRAAGPEVARLVGGAACMFAVAAAIEGLWSPSTAPAPVKWAFAVLQIVLVTLYLTRAGSAPREASP